jgi:predicted nucleic acid-binding protein
MIVLDTNIVSELMRPAAVPGVVRWVAARPASTLYTTSITVAEILYGVELLPRGKRRDLLRAAALGMFDEEFAGRIAPFNDESARAYAELAVERRRLGRPISHFDAQIAAIVRATGATLATRNVVDFADCGIEIVDPWGQS